MPRYFGTRRPDYGASILFSETTPSKPATRFGIALHLNVDWLGGGLFITASAYAPGIGTASYWTSPGACGAAAGAGKLFAGPAVDDDGESKAFCAILGVADGALLGGACSLKV